MDLNNLLSKVAQGAQHSAPLDANPKTLLVDGDALAYYCAGSADTSREQAKTNVHQFVAAGMRRGGCDRAIILLTEEGSNKGHRYAVARDKPYQEHRGTSHRPVNWRYLRDCLTARAFDSANITTRSTITAEADDLFSAYAHENPDLYVILTQDKDMQMVPGYHLTWPDMLMIHVPEDTWAMEADGDLWGRKWFWYQMLRGDSADNIPGLPGYYDGIVKSGANKGNPKLVKCGDVTVNTLLHGIVGDDNAILLVHKLYANYYGTKQAATLHMLEQGILLWMRHDPTNHLDVTVEGNPLWLLRSFHGWEEAVKEINDRINSVPKAQDDAGCSDSGATALEAGLPVRTVPPASVGAASSAGPRSLDGGNPSNPAPGVQRPPWED